MPIKLTSSGPNEFHLALKVVPGASRERIVGEYGDALKVAVTKPPEAGAANAAVEDFLRKQLDLPRRNICLVGGFNSRDKVIRIIGLTREQLTARLEALLRV
jgi:uncharacterized protein (TIGR00251 family)